MSSFLLRRSAFSAARSFSTTSPRSLAKITIIGNLADTPEVHTTNSGREIVRYSVASNSGPKDNRQTSWFRVSTFVEGPRREFMLGLTKGALVVVEGDASLNTYTDANGANRTALNIVQRGIEVLRRGRGVGESSEAEGHE